MESPHASSAVEPLMLLTSPWRLSLLFLVSGVATGDHEIVLRDGQMLPLSRRYKALLPEGIRERL